MADRANEIELVDELGAPINTGNPLPVEFQGGFEIPEYDEIDLGYTGDNLTTVIYSLATVVVTTLTLSYTGDQLTNVVKS